MKKLVVRSDGAARVRRGHPWVFSNEVRGRVADFEPGEIVAVEDSRGEFLGTATVNPRSLILARVISEERETMDVDFFRRRLARALAWRERLFPGATAYRLAYGEGDGLPGLVVDRYGDALVVQASTAGMDLRLGEIADALEALLEPRVILERNDIPVRALEGLELRRGVLRGVFEGPAVVEEGGVRFEVDLLGGQKTGYYFDHRDNRAALAPLARAGEVLDVFAYVGAWGLIAARAGASRVTLVDTSIEALALARHNAKANALADRCEFIEADAFDAIRALHRAGRLFDAVVVDPPAFVKSRKRLAEGVRGYRDLNAGAAALVRDGGILATSSCSYHLAWDLFERMVADAVGRGRRRAIVLRRGGQGADHPSPLLLPEAAYLKCLIVRVQNAPHPSTSHNLARTPSVDASGGGC